MGIDPRVNSNLVKVITAEDRNYGRTQLPVGTVVHDEGTYYTGSSGYIESTGKKTAHARTVAKATLPNGVELTLFKNSIFGQGSVTIGEDGATNVSNVDFYALHGTDGDDVINIQESYDNSNIDYRGNNRLIDLKKGNDTLNANIGDTWGNDFYGYHTTVTGEGSLDLRGIQHNTTIMYDGAVDMSKNTHMGVNYYDGEKHEISGVNPKKNSTDAPKPPMGLQ